MFDWMRRAQNWLEPVALFLIAAFCLGAWLTRPEKLFSLREIIDQNKIAQNDLTEVRLPDNWSEYFHQEQLSAYGLMVDHPLIIERSSSSSKLHQLSEHGSYFFYALVLNQRPSQFSLSIGHDNFKPRSMSTEIPTGAAIWRDRLNNSGSSTEFSRIKISAINPIAKSYLCDFVIYDAPGLSIWQ